MLHKCGHLPRRCGPGVATSLSCQRPKGLPMPSSSLLALENHTINTRSCGRLAGCCGREGMSSSVIQAACKASFVARKAFCSTVTHVAVACPLRGHKAAVYATYQRTVIEHRMNEHLLLSCSAWCDPLSRGKPTHTQHNLPSVRELQILIHDLPLKNADTARLHNRIYPDGASTDGTYLRKKVHR